MFAGAGQNRSDYGFYGEEKLYTAIVNDHPTVVCLELVSTLKLVSFLGIWRRTWHLFVSTEG